MDHTAGVRQGELDLYGAWRFSEVWVDMPDVAVPSRPAGRAPRLTVHRLDSEGYRYAGDSTACPSWTAAEIRVRTRVSEGALP